MSIEIHLTGSEEPACGPGQVNCNTCQQCKPRFGGCMACLQGGDDDY